MPSLYRGRTLSDAKEAALSTLGPDIILLNERQVRQRGVFGLLGGTEFEVEAEVAPRPLPPTPLLERESKITPPKFAPFANAAYALGSGLQGNDTMVSDDLSELRRDVRNMRALMRRLTNNTAPWKQELAQMRRVLDESRPVESGPVQVKRMLQDSGIDGGVARSLLRAVRRGEGDDASLMDGYRDALADRIHVSPWPLANKGRKVVAVVGSPGVGKTTTAAKLAARAIANDGKTVTFIAGDTYRVAAIDQLGRYASLLGAHMEVAETADDLHRIIRGSKSDLIIVDTAGRPPSGDKCIEAGLGRDRLNDGESTGWEHLSRHVLLCIPAALRAADADAMVQRYSMSGPTAIAVTKLDLTSAPGGLILGTACSDLPVSTLCMGQQVPEDISPATAGAILDYLVSRRATLDETP